mmetsp:Transcript_109924/g.234722  ORF Transcript_109924/g.234722 Transcript_109924/m.234722 type:complete len:346 (+) Transcript_109924:541-1578(+)
MAKARDHLARFQGVLRKLRKLLHRGLLAAKGLVRGLQPAQALLVGKAMERPSQAIQARREAEVGVAQGAAHKVRSVGRDVATLMVGMEHEVQTCDLFEGFVVVYTQHRGVVARPVQGSVGGEVLAIEPDVAEDARCQEGRLGHNGQGVVKNVGPVVRLLHGALPVGLAEGASWLHGQQGHGHLRHGVHGLREAINERVDVVRDHGALVELLVERLALRICGNLTCEHEPKGSLGQAHLALRRLRELVIAVVQGEATVSDPFHGVQQRSLAEQGVDATHAPDAHAHCGVPELNRALLLLQGCELRHLLRRQRLDLFGERAHNGTLGEASAGRCAPEPREHGAKHGL